MLTVLLFQPAGDRLHELFRILDTKRDIEKVLKYLKDTYPDNERVNEEERIFHNTSVRGGFPKQPPNYVSRSSLVSFFENLYLILQKTKNIETYCYLGIMLVV